jgi:hypothetical protein
MGDSRRWWNGIPRIGGRGHEAAEDIAEANIVLGVKVMADAARALVEREAREGL